MMDGYSGEILSAEQHHLKGSEDWKAYQSELLDVVRIQKKPLSADAGLATGTEIRRLREEAGLTQKKLGELTGLTERSVKRHEALKSAIRGTNREAYKKALSKALNRPIVL